MNILQELSPQLLNNSETSMSTEDSRCPVLHVGQQSTLAVPLHQFLTDGYLVTTFYTLTKVRASCWQKKTVTVERGWFIKIYRWVQLAGAATESSDRRSQPFDCPWLQPARPVAAEGKWQCHHLQGTTATTLWVSPVGAEHATTCQQQSGLCSLFYSLFKESWCQEMTSYFRYFGNLSSPFLFAGWHV